MERKGVMYDKMRKGQKGRREKEGLRRGGGEKGWRESKRR